MTGGRSGEPALNAVGDLILTDPQAMDALADPVRLSLLDELRRHGPATIEELAQRAGERPEIVCKCLAMMERVGLVERRALERSQGTTWAAIGKGFVFEVPEQPVGQAAARALSRTMIVHYADLPRRWAVDDEPELELEWTRAAGLLNARLLVTPEELRDLQHQLERVIAPFLTREPNEVPADAAHVRLLTYFLPEAPLRSGERARRQT